MCCFYGAHNFQYLNIKNFCSNTLTKQNNVRMCKTQKVVVCIKPMVSGWGYQKFSTHFNIKTYFSYFNKPFFVFFLNANHFFIFPSSDSLL